jgi:hypothetical protein
MINSIYKSAFTLAIILVTILSCNQDSGVVTKYQGNQGQGTDDDSTKPDKAKGSNLVVDELHTVVVDEVLPATKYVYVHVSEGANQFWVATALKDVHVGETYFYKGGLLKTNFESKEYNRTFERIYLVSQFVPAKHDGSNSHVHDEETPQSASMNKDTATVRKIERAEGSMSIAELVNDPKKYEGKVVQLSGQCVKINPKIMSRNWIHLKDGSKDDYDLVITSDIFVKEGTVITIKGTVALNKDYGAGYKYDLILEDGVIVE